MKLINVHTFVIEEFIDSNTPEYAILSHTWGQEEVTLREWSIIANASKLDHGLFFDFNVELSHILGISSFQEIQKKPGYSKIIACCEQAKRDHLRYVWVDTCCIDKTSSAELSEAINSMFQWYKAAKICYSYLSDVNASATCSQGEIYEAMRNSRWFTRGWTLQEFLAPSKVAFFDSKWNFISFKADVVDLLSSVTGISSNYISGKEDLQNASVAQKMSWASKRQTTRKEDIAYSLMGIFDVNMTLLYGEGDKAFFRLHEEIIKQSEDHSYLAWGFQMPLVRDFHNLFAPSPAYFAGCADLLHNSSSCLKGVTQMTNKGLQIQLIVWTERYGRGEHIYARLGCCGSKGIVLVLPIGIEEFEEGAEVWRLPGGIPVALDEKWSCQHGWISYSLKVIVRRTPPERFWNKQAPLAVEVLGIHQHDDLPFHILEVIPPRGWIPSRGGFPMSVASMRHGGRVLIKLAPSHTLCSKVDYIIIGIDLEKPKIEGDHDQSRLTRPSLIRAGVLLGNELQTDKMGNFSLAQAIFDKLGKNSFLFGSLKEFESEAEFGKYIISVEVQDGSPWTLNIKLTDKGKCL